jgi:hypothetical protein
MSIRKLMLPLLLVIAMLLISGCSVGVGINNGGSTSANGTPTSSLSPLQVLQNSSNAMQKLKSSHVDIQLADKITAVNTNATATPTTTGTPTATPTVQNVTLNVKGNGDQALPDQMQMTISATALNGTANLAEVMQGDKVYVQNTQGQWYVLNKSDLANMVGNPFAGVNFDQNSLLGLVMHSNITDHGIQALNGQNLRHISADLDKDALRQLVSQNPDLKSAVGQQDLDTLLNNTKTFNSSVDVWIDETNFYIHRSEFKLNFTADTSEVSGQAPQSVGTNLDSILDLSKFNEPVNITTPANATPTDNPGTVFGFGNP